MPSYLPLDKRDLNRLARLAREEREELFERHPDWAQRYRSRLLFSILCGPCADHFVNGVSGFIDFEVVSFFAEQNGRAFPMLRKGCRDFGPSRLERETRAPETFQGRQVWLTQRPMTPREDTHPLDRLQHYIQSARTPTAQRLRRHSAVFIEPEPLVGLLAWPALAVSPRRSAARKARRP